MTVNIDALAEAYWAKYDPAFEDEEEEYEGDGYDEDDYKDDYDS